MQDDIELLNYIIGGVALIITTLSGIVTMFYKAQVSDYKTALSESKGRENELKIEAGLSKIASDVKIEVLERRADECEESRNELRVAHARLEQRVAHMEEHKQNRDSIG